jgi:tetraacyldisaccharide 4'-kinase
MSTDTPTPPRSPWQRLYAAGHRARARWFARRADRLPVPVVSIGNLHWGGTGKTPITLAVAAHLVEQGRQVAILSRGYRSTGRGARFASRGAGLVAPWQEVGDEPALLAAALPAVPVAVAPQRTDAGRLALAELAPPPELLLLDDGFSHLALARDLDLLLLPSSDLFGNGRLAPTGRLREPLAASARAAAVLVTGRPTAEDPERVRQVLGRFGFAGESFASPIVAGTPVDEAGAAVPPGCRVFLVSAVARPARFAESAREAGLEVVGEVRFRDHHAYPQRDLDRIQKRFAASGADFVLTTAKDHVKLAGRLPVPMAVLPVEARPEPAFWAWFDARVAQLLAGGGTR